MHQLRFESKLNQEFLVYKGDCLSKNMAEVQKVIIDGGGREDAYQIQNSEIRRIP